VFELEEYAAMKATRNSDLEHGDLREAWALQSGMAAVGVWLEMPQASGLSFRTWLITMGPRIAERSFRRRGTIVKFPPLNDRTRNTCFSGRNQKTVIITAITPTS
jgi:hypothetical protein